MALVFPVPARTALGEAPPRLSPAGGFLSFEKGPVGKMPLGWGGGPMGTVVVDGEIVHDGRRCVRIERTAKSPDNFSRLIKAMPMKFSGKKIELRGFIRSENVSGAAGLWMREDERDVPLEFDNMQGQRVDGSKDWEEYSITLHIRPLADRLSLGVYLSGQGKAWFSDLRIFVDGKLVAPTPEAELDASAVPERIEPVPGKTVTVEQLRQKLKDAQGLPDAELARQLAGLMLTERLSSELLSSWKTGLPGAKSSLALAALASASAFLSPPESELPAMAPPDVAGQRHIVELAVDYLARTVPKLPNFFATRTTDRYEDNSSAGVSMETALASGKPWRATGSYRATVFYRGGKEVVDGDGAKTRKLKEEDKGLVTQGVFGPILLTVMKDAIRNRLLWSHWEQGGGGTRAVFRYAVPKDDSHYQVAYQGLAGNNNAAQENTGYHGEIAIDPTTGTILRLTLIADLEVDSSILRGEIVVEYGPAEIGGKTYTCPVRSVSLSEVRMVAMLPQMASGVKIIRTYKTMLSDVAFSDYHVFRSEVRLLPADAPPPPEPASSDDAAKPPAETQPQ